MDSLLLNQTIQRADFTISLANTFLVWGALFIAIATIGITIYFNREKRKDIDKAISEVLQKICDDDKIRAQFIKEMLQNGSFKEDLKAAIDIAARDQIDLDKECIFADDQTSQQMKGKL